MSVKSLGKLLTLNLVMNCKPLQDLMAGPKLEGEDLSTPYTFLTDRELYTRLVSDIDFSRLSKKDQYDFLAVDPSSLPDTVPMQSLYNYAMSQYYQEAHNRTCKSMGIQPTKVHYVDFKKSGIDDPKLFACYESSTQRIYVDGVKSPRNERPSFMLETLNGMTYQHSVSQNIQKLISNPESLNDKDYFVALTTALKYYVYNQLSIDDPVAFSELTRRDYTTPNSIRQEMFSRGIAKLNFISAGCYGGELQEELYDNEAEYYDDLSEFIGNCSLETVEEILTYFDQMPLNRSSDGLMGDIARRLAKVTASSFYNDIGAHMAPGQTVTEYIDQLEDEVFEEEGLDEPTKEEIDEMTDAMIEAAKESQGKTFEERMEDDRDTHSDLSGFDYILRREASFKVPPLPFHDYINPTQTTTTEQ